MADLLHDSAEVYDVVIVGGGPAGLSAALVLGRCRRQVLLCDSGQPRNARSRALHGYLTRDGIAPLELLRVGRDELTAYGVEIRQLEVTRIEARGDRFEVALAGAERVQSRLVLIATGVCDDCPAVPGLADCYGITAHHCPYCDGWERRDTRMAVIGAGQAGAGLALALKTWSADVALCTNGRARLARAQRGQLERARIPVIEAVIERLDHVNGHVRQLRFRSGEERPCDTVFFTARQAMHSTLAATLGCEFTRKGVVKTDHLGQTCVPGVYVVGDASRDVQFAVVAAAEGAKAAVAINKTLQARAGLAVTSAA
jgi:thioredoxin reductase